MVEVPRFELGSPEVDQKLLHVYPAIYYPTSGSGRKDTDVIAS